MRAPLAFGLDAPDGADAVDVALDVVAAERLAGAQRRLEVDARPGSRAAERGARERLGHRVERERARRRPRRRSGRRRRSRPSRRAPPRAQSRARRSRAGPPRDTRATVPDLADEPGEHRLTLAVSRRRRASRPSRGRATSSWPRSPGAATFELRDAARRPPRGRPGASSSVPTSSTLRSSSSLPELARQPVDEVRDELVVGALGVRARGHRLRGARRRRPAGPSGVRACARRVAQRQRAARRRRASARRRAAPCRRGRASKNAAASVGPPSSSSDWTPSAAERAQLVGERPGSQLEVEPVRERPAREDEPPRLAARRLDVARVEARQVGARGAAADRDRVDRGAQLVHEPPALLAASPSAARARSPGRRASSATL